MVAPALMSKEVKDIGSSCTIEREIIFFWNDVDISPLEHRKMVVLETCSLLKRDYMAFFPDSFSPYLYFYLPFIKDMRLLFHSSTCEVKVMKVLNFMHYRLAPYNWGFVKALEIMWRGLEGEVLELKVNLVANSNTYFGRAKKKMSFFYPIVDLSMLDILKVIHNGQLVDDKEMSPFVYPNIPQLRASRIAVMAI
ncbi:unnamed protein product [Vicia faba]|uniref:Uncharacterized protein n=1 Tax=Vicia faba TaxID=3906 RepID=A0AAV1AGQ0_VICFA|nr:unnamed protein product [Vicia faba]